MADCNNKPTLTFAYTGPTGPYTPPLSANPPGTLDYSTGECAQKESDYIGALMREALNAAAGPVNVFPLLGVYNQGATIDQVGSGFPLSSGTIGGYNVADGFNVNSNSWRSIQTGAAVVSTPAIFGYDFGTKKAWTAIGAPQERYAPGEPVRKKIATIKIQQGVLKVNRASQLRIEASDDGVTWHRIDVVNVPDSAGLSVLSVNSNAAYNKWRMIPVFFNGVASNDSWEVVQCQLLEMTQVSLDNIEDYVLLEDRDRSYSRTSTLLKCQYDLLDVQTELAKFGINLPQTYIFTCSFAAMVDILGRPVVVGDIVELPGEVQYDHNLLPVKKWLEVTDTGWSTEGYTMNWKPQLFRFYAQPILPSVEHKDILGLPGQVNSKQTDTDILTNGFLQNDQAYKSTEAIEQAAADSLPQTGSDGADLQSGMPLLGGPNSLGAYDGRDMYVEDAIPPNGLPYTTGDTLPTGIADGAFHRQTYSSYPAAIRPPERLLQYIAATGRWKVVEINRRNDPDSHKKTMARMMGTPVQLKPDDKP
jgi:hypothetical protein